MDESHQASSLYDMIIGRDVIHALGINILFDNAEIAWDNVRVKMQPPEQINGDWIDNFRTSVTLKKECHISGSKKIGWEVIPKTQSTDPPILRQ